MNRHPYLRAYMAGVAFPVAFLPFLVLIVNLTGRLPQQLEWIFIFQLIVIPNGFGLWNVLYVKLYSHWRHPIGLHGAALPFFIAPIGFVMASTTGILKLTDRALIYFDTIRVPYWSLAFTPFIALAAYYLIWKYVIGFLNRVLELPV